LRVFPVMCDILFGHIISFSSLVIGIYDI
jgi:hypothetical protein